MEPLSNEELIGRLRDLKLARYPVLHATLEALGCDVIYHTADGTLYLSQAATNGREQKFRPETSIAAIFTWAEYNGTK